MATSEHFLLSVFQGAGDRFAFAGTLTGHCQAPGGIVVLCDLLGSYHPLHCTVGVLQVQSLWKGCSLYSQNQSSANPLQKIKCIVKRTYLYHKAVWRYQMRYYELSGIFAWRQGHQRTKI